jgi:acyl-CoA thioesterase-1
MRSNRCHPTGPHGPDASAGAEALFRPARRAGPVSVLAAAFFITALTGPAPCSAADPAPRPRTSDPDRPLLYVALGDSTVYGVGATSPDKSYVGQLYQRLRSAYPRARLVNLGEGGATAADVRTEQLARALTLRPQVVTVSVGPNDITQRRTPQEYEEDIEVILTALSRRTRAVVVVNLIPDITVTPRFRRDERAVALRQRVEVFNEVLGRLAKASGAAIVDLFGPSQREVPGQPALISADDYHPSDQGYARWAELMWRRIDERLRRPP